jgi:hypothetical protein
MENTTEAVSAETASTESTQEQTPQEAPEIDVSELQKQLESIKNAQKGSDRKVSELEKERTNLLKELEEVRKSSMSAEEKLEYEMKIQQNKEKEFESKLKALETEKWRKEVLLKNSISPELEPYLMGDSYEAIEENAKNLLEGIRAQADKLLQERLTKDTPRTGDKSAEGQKTMKRSDFENLDPIVRGKYIADGYNIVD